VKIEGAVVNASPLILLFKSGLEGLLPEIFAKVIVPEAVWKEVVAGGESDAAATRLATVSWIQCVTVPAVVPGVLVWNLGDGESEVLTFALARRECRAVIDDRAARSCARTLGVRTLGTGGVLIMAKRRGLISSVSVELQRLRDAGFWLSDEIAALLKEQAGEAG
jgi:predicted nucleic acid-binding protein